MNNDQLAALLESFKAEIIDRIAALETKIVELAPAPPGKVQAEPIWDDLAIEDVLSSYEQTEAGWVNRTLTFSDFPGDKAMLDTSWFGVEAPTGRVLHGGDKRLMEMARAEALYFHGLDLDGEYGDSEPAKANISPEVAACLMCLRLVDVVQGGLGSNASRSWAAWANTTSLEELFRELKAASEGTGGPSGGQ